MQIKIIRINQNGDNDTFGELALNSEFECYTLERTDKLVPTGVYPISLYFSPKHQFLVPLLNGVPDRSFIEIHPANFASQLEGCIAIGTNLELNAIDNSKEAFKKLMEKVKQAIAEGESVSLEIVEAF